MILVNLLMIFLKVFGPQGRLVNKAKEEVQKMKEDFVSYAQFAPM